jgi:hypothetical protein
MWDADEWADLHGEGPMDFEQEEEHDNMFYCYGCGDWVWLDEIEEVDDIQYCSNCGEKVEEQ